jgi:hypothetical protein
LGGDLSCCKKASCLKGRCWVRCRLQVVEQSAERSLARADCSIPENFIHFTGSSKPSELHDSDGELALNLTTLLEVRPARLRRAFSDGSMTMAGPCHCYQLDWYLPSQSVISVMSSLLGASLSPSLSLQGILQLCFDPVGLSFGAFVEEPLSTNRGGQKLPGFDESGQRWRKK